MKRVDEKDKYDRIYRRVDAMYHKGYSNGEIVGNFLYLANFEVLDIIQKIDGLERIKKGGK
jgi:hypothetical protein